MVAVLGLDEVGEGLGLLDLGAVVVVVVNLGADVVHLVDGAALGAALNGALSRQLFITLLANRSLISVAPFQLKLQNLRRAR